MANPIMRHGIRPIIPTAQVAARPAPAPIAVPARSKIGDVSTDRNQAQQPLPQTAGGDLRTRLYTYFTQADGVTRVLYTGDRPWVKMTVTLQTAGPVAIGDFNALTPVTSGQGILLQTNAPVSFVVAKGTRIFIAATSINRVDVMLEPIPWLEQTNALIGQVVASIIKLGQALANK